VLSSAARTDTGPKRQLNEDRLVDVPAFGLFAVADGMGGHRAGDLAAQMVADAIVGTAGAGEAAIAGALQSVNAHLVEQAAAGGVRAMSGATIVSLLIQGDRYVCQWAGDSRAYLWRGGRLLQISRDHSFVQEMVDAGALSPAEARGHPRANVITRAVGVASPLLLDAADGALAAGDRFLLCSDGLCGVLDDEEIATFLAVPDLDRAADDMLAAALAKPAHDNVTLILVAVGEAGR
jgi:serine/threonine protein phosphatase PrpC